jgi:hypothetical protein
VLAYRDYRKNCGVIRRKNLMFLDKSPLLSVNVIHSSGKMLRRADLKNKTSRLSRSSSQEEVVRRIVAATGSFPRASGIKG